MRLPYLYRRLYHEGFKTFNDVCFKNVSSFNTCMKNIRALTFTSKLQFSSVRSSSQHVGLREENEKYCVEHGSSPLNIEDSDFSNLTNGDPALEKKLKILMLEVEVLRQSGARIPQKIKIDQWKELLEAETRSRRRKYLNFLFVVEKKRENEKLKKERLKELREMKSSEHEIEDNHLAYGLNRNSLFLRIYEASVTEFHNRKLLQAMRFSQKLVVDCGYDPYMTKEEAHNCAKQMLLLFSENRFHDNPFNLYFCNVNRDSVTTKQLNKFIPTLFNNDFPLNISDASYLDLFPKEDLVYLTPHCRENLKEFDHNAVYIIGAMVDKHNSEPLSLAKAKRDGLKMAKLPLEDYLIWGTSGCKSLTLDQMIKIMLEMHTSGDWNKALQHVPRRKIATNNEFKLNIEKLFKHSKKRTYY